MLIYKNTVPKEFLSILNGDVVPNLDINEDFDILGIKGDNLQSMCALLSTHKNSVKLSYADVPYNTGNKDFIYNDDFNTTDSLNYHSDWISWMLPRLIVSRELLTEDGVLVLSIDHNERLNLENLCVAVFGKENVLSTVTVVSNRGGGGRRNKKDLITTNEFLVVCTKNKNCWTRGEGILDDNKKKEYKPRSVVSYTKEKLVYHRKGQFYPFLVNRKTNEVTTISFDEYKELFDFISKVCFGYGGRDKKKYDKELHDSISEYVSKIENKYSSDYKVIFPKYDGKWGRWTPSFDAILNNKKPYDKLFINSNDVVNYYEELKDFRPMKTILDNPSYSNTNATETLKKHYGEKNFDTPKSKFLMRDIITEFTNDGDLVLDWCAGSNSTYEGFVNANNLQDFDRKYIFIQQEENGVDIFEKHSLERVKVVNSLHNLYKKILVCSVVLECEDNFYLKTHTSFNKEEFLKNLHSVKTSYRTKVSKFEKLYDIF